MKLCGYCEKPMDKTSENRNYFACAACTAKWPDVVRFVKVCNEFKKRIGYDEILKKRAEEGKQ